VFDKKRKRQGKEEGKKRLIKKTNLSSSFPHLFLISSSSLPNFITEIKKEFSNSLSIKYYKNITGFFQKVPFLCLFLILLSKKSKI
jgi:hypothetical protein